MEQLVEDNLKLVYLVVHRNCQKYLSCCEFDDLVAIGNIGLFKAAKKFDPSLGIKFSTYAVRLIYGEIQRNIRDQYDQLAAPRAVKDLYWKIIRQGLEEQAIDSIAKDLKVSEGMVIKALHYGKARLVISIYTPTNEGDTTLADTLQVESNESINLVADDMCKLLTDTEARIFRMHYLSGMQQQTIAPVIGISAAHISRILSNISKKIRRNYAA